MDAGALFDRAIRARQQQHVEVAVEAIEDAAKLAPNNPQIAAVRAQLHYESWRPASALFEEAARLNGGDRQLLRNQALALTAEGARDKAEALLEAALATAPDWIDGHKMLSRIRLTSGESGDHDRSFAHACRDQAACLPLHMAWFHQAAIERDWVSAQQILGSLGNRFAGQRQIDSARLFLAAESGEGSTDPLLAAVADIADPGLDLCRVRLYLRRGALAEAERIASAHIGAPTANMFWPYLSLIWRLTDNPRAHWLDGKPRYHDIADLDFSPAELAELADVLRRLHILQTPYPEQSVRGGTQTDRPLFFNPDTAIQSARRKIMASIANYIGQLPEADPAHPLLAPRRDEILFEGSWSVRLKDKGFHASHTHVMGWISSAFYVALPGQPGTKPSGWLGLGTPPPELGLELEPYATIEPKPGRLVLFPSTMWHGTFPFDTGERLTIAFDIRRPG